MIEIVIGILVFAGIVTVVLLRKGKFGSLKLGLGKDGVKAEVEAAKPPNAPAVQNDQVTTQHIHYGLDQAGITKLFEDQEKNIEEKILKLGERVKDSLSSGVPVDQKVIAEKTSLEQELEGARAKLADTQKALAERKTVLAETEKALENEKLKNSVSEEELAEAKRKLEEGDASALEELLSHYMKEKKSQDEPWAAVAHALGKLAEDRIDYQTAQKYYSQAVELASKNALYLNNAGFMANILGEHDQAIEYYEKALESDLKSFEPEHPTVAIDWNNLGFAWREKGEYDKAIEYYEKALHVVE